MLSKLNSIILGALCLLAVSLVDCKDILQANYRIGKDGVMRGIFAMIRFDNATRLPDFSLELGAASSLGPEDIKAELEKLVQQEANNEHEYRVRKNRRSFLALADHNCSNAGDLELFLLARRKETAKEFEKKEILDYVEHFGTKKVTECAEVVRRPLVFAKTSQLDEFFVTLLSIPGKEPTDDVLYDKLKKVNLLYSDLNFKKVVNLSGSMIGNDKAHRIQNYFVSICESYYRLVGRYMNFVSVSNAMTGRNEVDPKFLKLMEYDHMCWYTRMNSEGFKANILRNMKKH
jgi:hypothetical protein